ncbi:MAG: hypothetical protein JO166_04950 [Deltaproteobacteria bacterium]|nr:hypothetical protein [Deltaproteobacteria bacterium]
MGKPIRVEYMTLAQLRRAPRNPKAHDLDVIDSSIKRFGFVAPIVMDERTGRLVAGHGRLETLERAKAAGQKPPDRIIERDGEWLVPVIRGVEFTDDREAEAYVVADNQTTILGGWNEEELAAVLLDHAGGERGLQGLGYSADDLQEMLFRLGQDAPEFEPTDASEQSRLDAKKKATCPKCGHVFEP